MTFETEFAFDSIREAFGQVEDFEDFVLAAAQHAAIKRGDIQLADDIMHHRERHE